MPLIYALISRGLTVLCEYTSFSGNFSTVAVQCLSKVIQQKSEKRDKHTPPPSSKILTRIRNE